MTEQPELTPIQKAFFDLWESGHRLINEEEKDSVKYGIFIKYDGIFKGFTINGTKKHFKNNKINVHGFDMTTEEIEIGLNYLKFIRQFKH